MDGDAHEVAAEALAEEVCGEAEEFEFDVGEGAAVEFEEAFVFAVDGEGEDVDAGVVEGGEEFFVAHA